jgi:hypothetical protein
VWICENLLLLPSMRTAVLLAWLSRARVLRLDELGAALPSGEALQVSALNGRPLVAGGTAARQPPRASAAMKQLPAGWLEATDKETGRPYYYNTATGTSQWDPPRESRFDEATTSASERALTPDCRWSVKLELGPAESPVTLLAKLRFAEEDGYEPPQGFVLVESSQIVGGAEDALQLGQQSARWRLSEDPEDQKDSLWIWGLFKEPLYPFLLLELDLAQPVETEGLVIPAGRLYFQVDHRRKDGVVVLGEGPATFKVTEKLNADLVGLSNFNYEEPISCGRIRFLDTADDMKKSYI